MTIGVDGTPPGRPHSSGRIFPAQRGQVTGRVPLKQAGFYRSAEEVSAAANSAERLWESAATRYLDQGVVVVASPSWIGDLIDEKAGDICQYLVLTDGEWVWTSDLAYYVRTYHVELPVEFLDHMAACEWVVPEVDVDAVVALGEELMALHDVQSPVIGDSP